MLRDLVLSAEKLAVGLYRFRESVLSATMRVWGL